MYIWLVVYTHCYTILSHIILYYIYATARARVHDRADAQPGPGKGRALAGPMDSGKNTIYNLVYILKLTVTKTIRLTYVYMSM